MNFQEYDFTYKPESSEQAFNDGYHMGFLKAIELLRNPDRDQYNAGITSCIHSHEWATWLEAKVTESLKGDA